MNRKLPIPTFSTKWAPFAGNEVNAEREIIPRDRVLN